MRQRLTSFPEVEAVPLSPLILPRYDGAANFNTTADGATVSKRHPPPSLPTGPVDACLKPGASGSPPIVRILTALPIISLPVLWKNLLTTSTHLITTATTTTTIYSPSTTPPTTAPWAEDTDDMYLIDASLHSHPIDSFTDTDPPLTPMTLMKVYVDDQDYSTRLRSPSRGHLSSTDGNDDGLPSSSSSESGGDVSLGPARWRTRVAAAYPIPTEPSPMSEQHQHQQITVPVVVSDVESKEKAKKKKATRSYFSEYITTSASTTRTSSPERKLRLRWPRRLANAVSLALRNTSPSPKRTNGTSKATSQGQVVDDGKVLDIGPIPPESMDTGSSISEAAPQTSSSRSSAKVGWVKTMARKGLEVLLAAAPAELGPNSVSHLSNVGMALVEVDGAETPYMWMSETKPPTAPAPFIPVLPPPRLRRVDLAEQPLYSHCNSLVLFSS